MTRFKKTNAGFTLIELMVVASLLALLLGATVPSMISLFTSGADAQAVNLLSAQLTAARALAMRQNTHAGVHVQMGSLYNGSDWDPTSKCYVGIIIKDGDNFKLADGYPIQSVPGTMAFGQLTDTYADDNYKGAVATDLRGFTSFSIVFSPTGSLVTQQVDLDLGEPAFAANEDTGIWKPEEAGSGNPGVSAVTVFDYQQAEMSGNIANYLNENGQFLPINVHTGLLHPRR